MAHSKSRSEKSRKKELVKRRKRLQQFEHLNTTSRLSAKHGKTLDDAADLIDDKEFSEAERILLQLDRTHRDCIEVIRVLVYLYQKSRDHARCSYAAMRFAKLAPRSSDAVFSYAQAAMYCGSVVTATHYFRQFCSAWPNHINAEQARTMMVMMEAEIIDRFARFPFPEDRAEPLMMLHEACIMSLQASQFAACIQHCRELLVEVPDFTSARNNLAIALFMEGQTEEALTIAEETLAISPSKEFARSLVGKLAFLSGDDATASQMADAIMVAPPNEQDPSLASMELMALLGRDEDLLRLANPEAVEDSKLHFRAASFHYRAYAKSRLGDNESARRLWRSCVKLEPDYPEAQKNLDAMSKDKCYSPWALSAATWLTPSKMALIRDQVQSKKTLSNRQFSHLELVLSAILDRGDESTRELAFALAQLMDSPKLMEAIKSFAFGSRGSDQLRSRALHFLQQHGVVGNEPHRFFTNGKWTEVFHFSAEITEEPDDHEMSPVAAKNFEEADSAVKREQYDLAEKKYLSVLQELPDDPVTHHNLCAVWINRDGQLGVERAKPVLEKLRFEFPEYHFARLTLAALAIQDGNLAQARQFLLPVFQAKKLHLTAAATLLITYGHLSLAEGSISEAERQFECLRHLGCETLPPAVHLHRAIEAAKSPRSWIRQLLG